MPKDQISYVTMPGTEAHVRFLVRARRANSKTLERVKYLSVDEIHKEFHYIAHTENDRIVADLAVQQSPEESDVFWLKHVSVDPKFQNIGLATALLNKCVEDMVAGEKVLEISNYSEVGKLYLKPRIDALATRFPDNIRKPWLERELEPKTSFKSR